MKRASRVGGAKGEAEAGLEKVPAGTECELKWVGSGGGRGLNIKAGSERRKDRGRVRLGVGVMG